MNPTRLAVIDRIWRGRDPLLGFPANLFAFDVQGWNSQHPYLLDGIMDLLPTIIVEVGVWKGGSTIFMAECMKTAGINSVVIAVDTWLGSSEHWLVDEFFGLIDFMHGYPVLYHKFASNVMSAGVADHVVPLPIDSLNAAKILAGRGISPTMIHLDGAHDYAAVIADLQAWWPLLLPGGLLIGDDYYTNGISWPAVRQAFDDFFGALGFIRLENESGKCRVRKPAQ